MKDFERKTNSADPFGEMSKEEISDLIEVFAEDIIDNIDKLSNLFIDMEEETDNASTINSIMQIYHSIKGTGGTFGYPVISTIAHGFESVFVKIRNKSAGVSPDFIDLLFQSLDTFKQFAKNLKARRPTEQEEKKFSTLLDTLSEYIEKGEIKSVQKSLHITTVSPEKDTESDYVKLKSDNIDRLVDLTGEIMLRKRFNLLHDDRLKAFQREIRNQILSTALAEEKLLFDGGDHDGNRQKLERFASERKAGLRELEQKISAVIKENREWTEQSEKLISDLQREVLQVRMVTISDYFKQLKRTVRDLVKQSDKKIRFQIAGLDTELDRRIIEEIKDPLVHLIRNAIDHGMESPGERRKAHKPEEGTIKVSAQAAGNEITILVEDDGRGIDTEAVKRTAITKGLYDTAELDAMQESDIKNIIFQPGFSTRETVSKISGRGVGLDVVKSNVERISGFLHVDSEPGTGTRFTVKIPITLAAFQAVFCRVGSFFFYVQSIAVEKIIRITPDYPRPGKITSVSIDERTIPYAYLGEYFSLTRESVHSEGTFLILLRAGGKSLALEVDECLNQHDIVIKPVADLVSQVSFVSGVSFLPDGNIAYVLEPSELISRYENIFGKYEEQSSWVLENIGSSFFTGIGEAIDETRYNIARSEKKLIVLHVISDNKPYGIPVKVIDRVCNLADKNLAQKLENSYDSILSIENDTAAVINREDIDVPVRFEGEQAPRAAVVLKVTGRNCIFLPDKLVNIDIIDPETVVFIEKEDPHDSTTPGIIRLDKVPSGEQE